MEHESNCLGSWGYPVKCNCGKKSEESDDEK